MLLAGLFVLSACSTDRQEAPAPTVAEATPEPGPLERASAAGRAYSERLRSALRDHMGHEGPVSALDFCHDEAPQIAAAVMAEHGVRLGRVAIAGRERNPAHAPNAWQQPVLERFAAAVAAGEAPEDQVAVLTDGLPDEVALRLLRGIRVEPQCQVCHGRELSPGIAETVARLYPADRATGFLDGDLRGALWVEVPASTVVQESRHE